MEEEKKAAAGVEWAEKAPAAPRRRSRKKSAAKGKPKKLTDAERTAEIAKLEQEMKEASKMLEFEYAAVLRDQIIELRGGK